MNPNELSANLSNNDSDNFNVEGKKDLIIDFRSFVFGISVRIFFSNRRRNAKSISL